MESPEDAKPDCPLIGKDGNDSLRTSSPHSSTKKGNFHFYLRYLYLFLLRLLMMGSKILDTAYANNF